MALRRLMGSKVPADVDMEPPLEADWASDAGSVSDWAEVGMEPRAEVASQGSNSEWLDPESVARADAEGTSAGIGSEWSDAEMLSQTEAEVVSEVASEAASEAGSCSEWVFADCDGTDIAAAARRRLLDAMEVQSGERQTVSPSDADDVARPFLTNADAPSSPEDIAGPFDTSACAPPVQEDYARPFVTNAGALSPQEDGAVPSATEADAPSSHEDTVRSFVSIADAPPLQEDYARPDVTDAGAPSPQEDGAVPPLTEADAPSSSEADEDTRRAKEAAAAMRIQRLRRARAYHQIQSARRDQTMKSAVAVRLQRCQRDVAFCKALRLVEAQHALEAAAAVKIQRFQRQRTCRCQASGPPSRDEAIGAASGDEPNDPLGAADVAKLVAMGFAEDEARAALFASGGSVDAAVGRLLGDGTSGRQGRRRTRRDEPFPQLRALLGEIRRRLTEVRQHLRETLSHHWERRDEIRERAGEDARERLRRLQATIAELRARLAEASQQWGGSAEEATQKVRCRFEEFHGEAKKWGGSAQEATEKIKDKFEELHGEAKKRLETLDAQLADSQQFLAEALQAFCGHASAAFEGLATNAGAAGRGAAASEASTGPEDEDSEVAVAKETADAAVVASESAAEAAIATLDEFLRVDELELFSPESVDVSGASSSNLDASGAASSSSSNACGTPGSAADAFGSAAVQPAPPPQVRRRLSEGALAVLRGATELFHGVAARRPAADVNGGAALGAGDASAEDASSDADAVAQLLSMGFSEESARASLVVSNGRVEEAVEHLLMEDAA